MKRSDTSRMLTRRHFLKGAAAITALSGAVPLLASALSGQAPSPEAAESRNRNKPPRRCGFNLHNMHSTKGLGGYEQHDFRWMSEWGFDWVRIPVAYQLITLNDDPYELDEWWLDLLDRAMEYGPRYGVHVCLAMQSAPGKKSPRQPYSLWKDQEALDAFCFLWKVLAERYKGISPAKLSFNLINEPPPVGEQMSALDYKRVAGAAAAAIRQVRPDRPIVADGTKWANFPCPELKDLDVGQSVHMYVPWALTHHEAPWMAGWESYPEPQWPGVVWEGVTWNRDALEEYYRPWFELAEQGVSVHCGEMGVYNKTPHAIALAWMRDVLDMLKSHNIGWALWNFRGEFGILDSDRADIEYEDFNGHKLDRKLLALLQEFA